MPISNDVLIGQTLTYTVGHMVRINSTLLNFAQFHLIFPETNSRTNARSLCIYHYTKLDTQKLKW